MALPDLYTYLDYRSFLRDWFQAKKALNRRFSHRAFVRMAGQRSPSMLVDVIERRRNLTTATTEAFCRALKLGVRQATFFTALVHLDQAETPAARNEAWSGIAATRRFREARRLEGDAVEFLSSWHYSAIHELVKTPSFRPDPAWIVRALRPKITVPQARRALEVLQEMGLLRIVDGSAEQQEATVTTPHEVGNLATLNYHLSMGEQAIDAVQSVSSDERHFVGLTVAVPESMLPVLKQELNTLQERLLELCDGTEETPDRVVQVGLQFFPLTTTPLPKG